MQSFNVTSFYMISSIHLDAFYLTAPLACSRVDGHYFSGFITVDGSPITLNSAIHTLHTIHEFVTASAAEEELCTSLNQSEPSPMTHISSIFSFITSSFVPLLSMLQIKYVLWPICLKEDEKGSGPEGEYWMQPSTLLFIISSVIFPFYWRTQKKWSTNFSFSSHPFLMDDLVVWDEGLSVTRPSRTKSEHTTHYLKIQLYLPLVNIKHTI